MRIAVSALALALVSLCAARPAHAIFGAVGWLGMGHVFEDGDDERVGPTVEIGGSFSVPFAAVDITYWNDTNQEGDFSEIRGGARLSPPFIPFYGRAAIGLPFNADVRDVLGADVVIGVGYKILSLPLINLNVELDYHYWTAATDFHPLEAKVGAAIGF
jgi:hypothetical protein